MKIRSLRATALAAALAVLAALFTWAVASPASAAATVTAGATTVVAQGTATSGASLATPAGVTTGDVLVAQFTADLTPTVTTPSGWTAIAAPLTVSTGARLFSYLHVVTDAAAEPATYSFPFSAAEKWGGTLTDFHGVDGTHPLDSTVSTKVDSSYSASTLAIPSVTTATVGAMAISGVGADRRDALFGVPSGATQAGQAHDGQGTALGYFAARTATGATGTATWSMTAGTAAAGWMVALRPGTGTTPTPTPTTTPTTSSSPPPTSSSPPPTSTSSSPPPTGTGPHGPAGNWVQTFDDEFNGTALDTTKWAPNWYGEGGVMNKVATYKADVTESGGSLNLALPDSTHGALVHTDIAGGYRLPVGSCVEAEINFPGSGSTIYNWPAWWASAAAADGWPSSGEHDIAEGLGPLTINYHSPSGAHNFGAVAGTWAGAYHDYTLCRNAGSADVYWDGVLRKHYTTDDNGKPEILILNVGVSNTHVYGAAATVHVNYVRAFKPA